MQHATKWDFGVVSLGGLYYLLGLPPPKYFSPFFLANGRIALSWWCNLLRPRECDQKQCGCLLGIVQSTSSFCLPLLCNVPNLAGTLPVCFQSEGLAEQGRANPQWTCSEVRNKPILFPVPGAGGPFVTCGKENSRRSP